MTRVIISVMTVLHILLCHWILESATPLSSLSAVIKFLENSGLENFCPKILLILINTKELLNCFQQKQSQMNVSEVLISIIIKGFT